MSFLCGHSVEDREMARKVRSFVNVRGLPSGKPSFKPPKKLPPNVVSNHIFYQIYSMNGTDSQLWVMAWKKKSVMKRYFMFVCLIGRNSELSYVKLKRLSWSCFFFRLKNINAMLPLFEKFGLIKFSWTTHPIWQRLEMAWQLKTSWSWGIG